MRGAGIDEDKRKGGVSVTVKSEAVTRRGKKEKCEGE